MTRAPRTTPAPAVLALGLAAVAILVVLAGLSLAGVDVAGALAAYARTFFPPDPSTDRAREIDRLYQLVFWIAVAIFLAVEGAIVWAVLRYRRRPTDTDLPPQTHGNTLVEVIWTAIPTVIVVVLFGASWLTLNAVDATSDQPDLRVRAVGARFQWTFEYLSPDGRSVVYQQFTPELVVPVDRTIQVSLRSPDVIHAFYVPRFLFKRDVIPGKENVFDFRIDPAEAGQTFRGQCAELCGAQHWAMQFTVRAVTPEEFDAWLEEQIAQSQASPSPAPSGAPGQVELQLAARNIQFDTTALEAPAGTPFTIVFANEDPATPHNVEIRRDGQTVFKGEIFPGVETRPYPIPPLEAGTYEFLCTVHPNMTGTLTVK